MNEPDQAHRRRAHLALETTEPTTFGYGFISGLLSAILGIVGFGLVLSARLPEYLTQTDLRPLYLSPYLRAAIHLILVASFLLGSISAVLRANKALAFTGIGLTLAAALLGGSQAPQIGQAPDGGSWLALDFFVLNLLLYSAVFIPLERLFALRGDQPVTAKDRLVTAEREQPFERDEDGRVEQQVEHEEVQRQPGTASGRLGNLRGL